MDADLSSRTVKLTVGGYDLYLHVGFDADGRPVHVDLFLGSHSIAVGDGNVEAQAVLADQASFLKGALEVITRQASALLAARVWTLDDLIAAWRGTVVYHGGLFCVDDRQCFASGPLDAAARVIAARKEQWTECLTTAVATTTNA